MSRRTITFSLEDERDIILGFHEQVDVDWLDDKEAGQRGWEVRGVDAPRCRYHAPFEASTTEAILSWMIKRMTQEKDNDE